MAKTVRLGLVGTGRIGRLHVHSLTRVVPEADLHIVADINVESAKSCAEEFEVPHAEADYETLLEDQSIEAVVICSATDTHADFITRAAQAGKHIFCEKPISLDLADADRALEAVKGTGVKLMIGFNRRFDAGHRRIRRAIEEGEIGKPHLLRITNRDAEPPPIEIMRRSGNMFFDMAIHDFDLARFFVGEVTELYTIGGVLENEQIGDLDDVDTSLTTLKFECGAMGVIDNSRRAVYGYDQRMEVLGTKGSVASENVYPDTATVSTVDGVNRGNPWYSWMTRYLPACQLEIAEFVECLLEGKNTPATGADGRAALVMAMAATKSWRENRPVKLEEIG